MASSSLGTAFLRAKSAGTPVGTRARAWEAIEHRPGMWRCTLPRGLAALDERQELAARLKLKHRDVLGEVVGYERDGRGNVWATCVTSAIDLLRCREPIFYSAELRERDGEMTITAIALVRDPAMIGLEPVRILAGDLRLPETRWRWRLPKATRNRIERAGVSSRRRPHGEGMTIVDAVPRKPEVVRLGRPGCYLVDD